ncbi:fungal-specific transcription factor domain-containing protein [Ilyonectria sp. MPI-CAGE-AT-0026]|nr:fungal-specific transcription factor domain-containing protein [Ilyonectria sp. MPI-CAGE-AT-0026]
MESRRANRRESHPKCAIACNYCRSKKIRCNGGQPCPNCRDHSVNCQYPPPRRYEYRTGTKDFKAIQERLMRLETLLPVEPPTPAAPTTQAHQPFEATMEGGLSDAALNRRADGDWQLNTPTPTCSPQAPAPPSNASNASRTGRAASDSGSTTAESFIHHQPPHSAQPTQPRQKSLPPNKDPSHSPGRFSSLNRVNQSNASDSPNQGESNQLEPAEDIWRIENHGRTHSFSIRDLTLASSQSPGPLQSIDDGFPQDVSAASRPQGEIWNPNYDHDAGTGLDQRSPQVNYEYHGSNSFLSICSQAGVNWVSMKTGVPGFSKVANQFKFDLYKRLKLENRLAKVIEPEPNPKQAWLYSQAYFNHSGEATFGFLPRHRFETRLHTFLQARPKPVDEEEPAWYALRNAVYAVGCRVLLGIAQRPETFKDAHQLSWRFFENALSVHTELIYGRATLTSVQALLVMGLYVKGISSPSLDYMLCANAVRLAESMGLHRRPMPGSISHETDAESRSCLWWAIYCYERLITSHSGRSAQIDDNSITCPLPSTPIDGSEDRLQLVSAIIQHALISAEISREVLALKRSKVTVETILDRVAYLDGKLQKWRDSCPLFARATESGPRKLDLPAGIQQVHIHFLSQAHFMSTISIHSLLACPWDTFWTGKYDHTGWDLFNPITMSANTLAETSRKVIHQLQYAEITPATPKWLAFVAPMSALINLFAYVLQYPLLPTAESDIALLDQAAGYFSFLEYTMPELAFPFTRDVASLARISASRAAKERVPDQVRFDDTIQSEMVRAACSNLENVPFSDIDDETLGIFLSWADNSPGNMLFQ